MEQINNQEKIIEKEKVLKIKNYICFLRKVC